MGDRSIFSKGLMVFSLANCAVLGVALLPSGVYAAPLAVDPAAVTSSVAAIDAAIASVGSKGSVDAYQGAISLALDQTANPGDAIIAAIDIVLDRRNLNSNSRKALLWLRRNYKKFRGTGGTGNPLVSNFGLSSGPNVGGGGSSNYSSPSH